MDVERVARFLAVARIAPSVAFLAAPRRLGALFVGPGARQGGAALFARGLAVRDILLGAGTLLALRRRQPVRPWLASCAIADTVDAVATLASFRELPRKGGALTLAAALVAAALDGWAAARASSK